MGVLEELATLELLDAAALELAVEEAEQAGVLREQLLGVLAVALSHAPYKLHSGFLYGLVFLDLIAHDNLSFRHLIHEALDFIASRYYIYSTV